MVVVEIKVVAEFPEVVVDGALLKYLGKRSRKEVLPEVIQKGISPTRDDGVENTAGLECRGESMLSLMN